MNPFVLCLWQTRYMVSGTPHPTLDSINSEDMSVVRVLSKFIALQGSVTTVRCLCRKLVHRWRSIMMFGRLYHSFCSGVKPHPTYFTSSSTMFAWLISTGSSSTSVDAASWRIRLNLTWLAAAKCHRCYRRYIRQHCCSNVFTIFREVQAICRSWWIMWSVEGVRRVVRRGYKRSVLYAESEELH